MLDDFPSAIEFLKVYHRHRNVSPTLDKSGISPSLPSPLETFYLELGGLILLDQESSAPLNPPFHTQDSLLAPPGPETPDAPFLIADENQSVFHWLVDPDTPPFAVSCNAPAVFDEDDDSQFELVEPRLDHFLITFALSEAVTSSPFLDQPPSRNSRHPFTKEGTPIWIDKPYYMPGPQRSFYYFPDYEALAMMCKDSGIWLGSYNQDAAELLNESGTPSLEKAPVDQTSFPPLTKIETDQVKQHFEEEGRLQATNWLQQYRECSLTEANAVIGEWLSNRTPDSC